MGKFKHYKGSIGGGVDVSHKSKMSGKAKSLMSFPGGMPGPGEYGSMNNKVVGKGMMKYMAGEPVGMGKYGKHMGPEKELVGKQKNLPEELKAKIEAAPGKYGHKKGPAKKKKYIQDKESKIEGKAKRIIGSGSGTVLASRDKKEVGKKYKGKGPNKHGKHKGPKQEGVLLTPRQKEAAAKKAAAIKKGKEFQAGNFTSSDSGKSKKPMSDGEKIQASKAKKEAAGNKKKAEGQADLKKAKSQKFISKGSGEDSGIATREERRKAIRAARAKKRAGRKEARKARKKTVIKQKI